MTIVDCLWSTPHPLILRDAVKGSFPLGFAIPVANRRKAMVEPHDDHVLHFGSVLQEQSDIS